MWVSRSRLEKSLVIPLAMWPVKAGGTIRSLARRQTPPLNSPPLQHNMKPLPETEEPERQWNKYLPVYSLHVLVFLF